MNVKKLLKIHPLPWVNGPDDESGDPAVLDANGETVAFCQGDCCMELTDCIVQAVNMQYWRHQSERQRQSAASPDA